MVGVSPQRKGRVIRIETVKIEIGLQIKMSEEWSQNEEKNEKQQGPVFF